MIFNLKQAIHVENLIKRQVCHTRSCPFRTKFSRCKEKKSGNCMSNCLDKRIGEKSYSNPNPHSQHRRADGL